MSSVSVVILNYNKIEDLRRNLDALCLQTVAPIEIIVVDNHSSDDSVKMVRSCFPGVIVFEMGFNSGVSAGRNFGYKHARGDIIVSLDDDSVCPPDTVEKTIALLDANASVGCLAYLIRTVSSQTLDNISLSTQLGNYHGAGHAFRSLSLRKIDFLDERYFFGAEEIDTSLRLLEQGYITRYTPEIVIDHYVRVYKGAERHRRMALWIKNWAWFYGKYFPSHYAFLFIARLLVSYLFITIKLWTWQSFFSGVLMVIRDLPDLVKVRRVTTPKIVAFYVSKNTEPVHFNIPFFVKALKKMSAIRS